MKMNLRKAIILLFSIAFMGMFLIGSNVNADVSISNVNYPETIVKGQVIDVAVRFTYATNFEQLVGPYVDLYYSVNSRSIGDDNVVRTAVGATSRQYEVSFIISTSQTQVGDILRFEIRYRWSDTSFVTFESEFTTTSGKYQVVITNEAGETSASIIGITIAFATIGLVVIRKKRKQLV